MPRLDPTPSRRQSVLTEWLLLVGGLAALGGFVVFSLFEARAAIDERERGRLTAQAEVIHANIGRQLDSINLALVSVRDEIPRWSTRSDGMAEANRRLKAFTDAMPGVRTMSLLDADGNVLASNREDLVGSNFHQRAYFQTVLKDANPDTLHISPPFQTSLGIWAMNAVRRVAGPDGEFAGMVSATLDPEEFRIVLGSVRYAPDMWTALAHGDGALFLMVPERAGLSGTNLAQPGSLFSRHRESGQAASVMTDIVRSTGEYRMMAQRTIQPPALAMDKPLVVAVSRDMAALHAAWRHDAWAQGGLFALLATFSVPGLILLQRRRRQAWLDSAAAEDSLRRSRERLAIATDSAGIGIWDLDLASNRLIWDDWMHRIHGLPPDTFPGTFAAWRAGVHADDVERVSREVQTAQQGNSDSFESEFRIVHPDGTIRHIKSHARIVRTADGTPARMTGVNIDITDNKLNALSLAKLNAQLQAQSELLRSLAFVDGLTGVANRRRFDENLDTEWRRCRRDGTPLALLMIDIDHFKLFNDQHGHQAGDACLQAVAAALETRLGRSHDLVARYGGEEFVCLLPDSDAAGARGKAEELRLAIEALTIDHETLPTARMVTISVGVAVAQPSADTTPAQLIEAADTALYAAKTAGRNRVQLAATP